MSESKTWQTLGTLLTGVIPVISLLFASTGCRQEMYDQPNYRPLKATAFFPNRMTSRPIVPNTVARGHLNEDEAYFAGKIGTNLVETFPMEITRDVLARGQQRYDIYCSPCHSRTGEGNGMIVQRGFPPPPSYHIERLRAAPVGHFYDVITHGYGIMYSYANRVSVEDRWAIAAYIRALQLSRNVRVDDLAAADRIKLEEGK